MTLSKGGPVRRGAALVFASFAFGTAFAQPVPDAGRLLEGTREAPDRPRGAAEIRIEGPLQGRSRKPPTKPARADLPPPTPDSEVVGTFSEKDLMTIVSGMLGKQVTEGELREMRAIALAIVACFRSPACSSFAKDLVAASGMTDALKGGLASAKPKPPPAPRFRVEGFRFRGNDAVSEAKLQDVLKDYAGQDLSLDEMQDAAGLVEEHYRSEGYFVARAFLPQQESKDGVLEISVLEGRVGTATVQAGASRLAPGVAEGIMAEVKPGAPIDERTVERALLLLSDLPGTRVRSTLSPGAQVGTADFKVEVEDTGELVRGSVEFDNFGSAASGRERVSVSANLINPSGHGDVLGFRGTLSTTGETKVGRLSYTIPLGPWGTRFGANYSQLEYTVGAPFVNLGARGDANVLSLFAQHPFVRTRNHNAYGFLGFDHKQLEDRFDSINTKNPRTSNLLIAGFSGDLRDSLGLGGLSTFSAMYTRGDLAIEEANQRAADLAATGRRTAGTFEKYNLGLTTQRQLHLGLTLHAALTTQLASQNLDSSERVSLGGPSGVRGYPVGELPADELTVLNFELRTSPFGFDWLPGNLTPYAFYDVAWNRLNRNPRITDVATNENQRRSPGIGLDWTRPSDFSLRLMLAWRYGSNPATAGLPGDRPAQFWFQGTKWF